MRRASVLDYVRRLDRESFAGGLLFGLTLSSVTAVAFVVVFISDLRAVEVDGTDWGSTGGILIPSFFLSGAQDLYTSVEKGAAEAVVRFRETGRFEAIYSGIQRSQETALLEGLDVLRDRFPRTLTRELGFNFITALVRADVQVAADLFDFALHLQRSSVADLESEGDILDKLWKLDEGRCSVTARRLSKGRRLWGNPDADILIDKQAAALRTTIADIAHRPLFARVAPEILARPTYLALIRLFDVFQCPECGEDGGLEYSEGESATIQQFLVEVTRTAVMRRAFRHVSSVYPFVVSKESWTNVLRRIWFHRREGRPCVFEHVFLGNLQEDASGQPIAGGLHCWLKFYLEEARGTAKYLGYIYNKPELGLADNRFVSGKFVWDYEGYRLVKDQGGFFIGASPEWQFAWGTVAYFETATPELAAMHGWEPWLSSRDVGYTKDVVYDGFSYRHVVCCRHYRTEELDDAFAHVMPRWPQLTTTFATFQGTADREDDPEMEELERVYDAAELAARLPRWLVAEGIALQAESDLSSECVRFMDARGCRNLREALREIRGVFDFGLEDAVAAARSEGYERMRGLVADTVEVAPLLLAAADKAEAIPEASLVPAVQGIIKELKSRGRKGPRVHQPLRLLLTGQGQGAAVPDIVRLLELAQREGGDEVGVLLRDRIAVIRELFSQEGRNSLLKGALLPVVLS